MEGKTILLYRDKRIIWKEERTVVVFISEKLKTGQIRGIHQSLRKIEKQMILLQESLRNPNGRKRAKEQLTNRIESLVKGQYIKGLIEWDLNEISECKFDLQFTIKHENLGKIEKKLGFRILMTDHHDWGTENIIKAYYGQSMIEHAFKNIKNPYHLALRPQYHWTDQKIKTHFFICVMGYLLSTIVWRQARMKAGFKGTLDSLLDMLNNIRLSTMLEDSKTCGKVKAVYKLEEASKEEKMIIDALGIENTHNKRLKFNGVSVYN